jgi:hypothetical protein
MFRISNAAKGGITSVESSAFGTGIRSDFLLQEEIIRSTDTIKTRSLDIDIILFI